MSFNWSTYQPRKARRNGFETMRMYCNWFALIVAVAFTALITLLMAGCAREMAPLFNRVW